MSPKQQKVHEYLRKNETLTLDQAVELIGRDIYANKKFHVGNVLGNMVKKAMIQRRSRGVYQLPKAKNEPNFRLEPMPEGREG